MIDSLFILTGSGTFVVEKHLKSAKPHARGLLDPFFRALSKREPQDVPKAIRADGGTALLHIFRNDMFYLAVVSAEICPLAVFDLLLRFYAVIQRYIGIPTVDSLRAHFSTSYLILDEMMDSGFPFTTDLNQIEAIITPPTALTKVVQVVSGTGSAVRNEDDPDPMTRLVSTVTGAPANVPSSMNSSVQDKGNWWRRNNIQYGSNEVYADVIERVNCILDSSGNIAMGGIAGEIQVNSKLSGASPECRLNLRNPDYLKNASFHPCVRVGKFREQNVLSFIPPDGTFTLCSYWLRDCMQNFPITVSGGLTFHEDMGKLHFSIQPRLAVMHNASVFLDRVTVNFILPDTVASCDLHTEVGQYKFISSECSLVWTIGKLTEQNAKLEGTFMYQRDKNGKLEAPEEEKCSCSIQFQIKGWAMSGFKLDCLDVCNVPYTPYKGCRYRCKSGEVEVRLM